MGKSLPPLIAYVVFCGNLFAQEALHFEAAYQYHLGEMKVPRAREDEAVLPNPSLEKALQYLDTAALIWVRQAGCVSCHTAGTYMLVRSQLTIPPNPPFKEIHEFFIDVLSRYESNSAEWFRSGSNSEQVIYTAAGLAEWDAHVEGRTSAATDRALRIMLRTQLDTGTWNADVCWPPLESSAYQAATIAARALAVAPGWLDTLADADLRRRVTLLKSYLKSASAQNDYDRVSLLWTAARLSGLLTDAERDRIIQIILRQQRPDGGWSVRSFSKPEAWGDGSRARRLRAENDSGAPPSDGHMTGLAIIVLRESGIPSTDAHIQRALSWLRANQRVSGRWWTRSLNTDTWHFITFSGTAYPLLALWLCGER
ncbi:MAG: hypothetical protein LAP39_21615 [Acidobacteriia bacterium]|nr:hypothetical protein [Terriglobia bacterium]